MVGVDGLDIRRHLFRPLRHDRNIAAVASGLICKLPAELEYCQHRKTTKCKTDNSGLILVAGDEDIHIILERSLDGSIGIEEAVRLPASDNLSNVSVHATVVLPIVSQRDNESDARRLGSSHHGVKLLETVGTVVDSGSGTIPELIVGTGRTGNIVPSPNSKDSRTGLGNLGQSLLNESSRAQLGEPVCVGSNRIESLAIQDKLLSIRLDKSCGDWRTRGRARGRSRCCGCRRR